MSPRASRQRLLTEVELEIMNHLWRLGEGGVNDLLAVLPRQRKLAYTSVSTMLRILEQKKIVRSRKEGRAHVYIPVLSKEEYEQATLHHLVNEVFDGSGVSLARRLIDTGEISASELEELRRLIDERTRRA